MRPRPHTGIRSFAILLQQGLALARRYAKMALHGFTSTGSDKLLHLPSLEVKHFPFNVVLFNMLVLAGGRERTEAEFRVLFEAAGFNLTRIIPTQGLASVVEGI